MDNFKVIGPAAPFDDDGRIDVRANTETGKVEIILDGQVFAMPESQARRFSVAYWGACNDAERITYYLNRKRKMGARVRA